MCMGHSNGFLLDASCLPLAGEREVRQSYEGLGQESTSELAGLSLRGLFYPVLGSGGVRDLFGIQKATCG